MNPVIRKWYVATILLAVLLAAVSTRAAAECVCGYEDGRFTVGQGVSINGFMDDWVAILEDPDNNICDGGEGGIQPQPDLDAPIQSTGRDIVHFAYTWDKKGVQTYTERVGSAENKLSFIYYADTDNDGLMENGERIIVAVWQGNNQKVEIYLGTYVAVMPGGDSMSDADGFGDGYTLPGTIDDLPNKPNYYGFWGNTEMRLMEWEISWSDLGLPPGSPFAFHISTTNSNPGAGSFPGQIDDNMGGCGGGAASTQYADLTFEPDRTMQAGQGITVYAAHTIENLGNGADTFNLVSFESGDFSPVVNYYNDADGSGTLNAGDALLTDTDGDGNPDTGPLAATSNDGKIINGTIRILIEYSIGADAGTATVVTTATSAFQSQTFSSVTDTITVVLAPDLVIMKTVQSFFDPVNQNENPKSIPGAVMLYTIQVTNFGAGAVDADTVVITDPIPEHTSLVLDVNGTGNGPVEFLDGHPASGLTFTSDDVSFSSDNADTYNYTPTTDANGCDIGITHLKINPKGTFNGSTGENPSFTLRFKVRID